MAVIIAGAVANNVTLASQNMRDYLPLLWFAVALFACSIVLLIYAAIRGRIVLRIAAVLGATLAIAQLVDAAVRLHSIFTLTAG
jgi:hypothetical protein